MAPELSRFILNFHEHQMTRIGETRGPRCHVPLHIREENSFSVASSQWALSGLFIAFLKEHGSTPERAPVGEGIVEAATN